MEDEEHISTNLLPRCAGTVGKGQATAFITFAEEFSRLPKFQDIIRDPSNTLVPPESSTKYATAVMLMEKTDENTIEQVLKYIGRFDIEMQIVFCRGFNVRMPKLRSTNDTYSNYLLSMIRYLK